MSDMFSLFLPLLKPQLKIKRAKMTGDGQRKTYKLEEEERQEKIKCINIYIKQQWILGEVDK